MSGDCACMYGNWDCDNDFESQRWVRARKPHKCCECGREINVGERHEVFVARSEGQFFSKRTCAECQDVRESLYCNGGWIFGALWSDVEEQIFAETGLTVACIDKLATLEGKTKLQTEWMRYVEENGR